MSTERQNCPACDAEYFVTEPACPSCGAVNPQIVSRGRRARVIDRLRRFAVRTLLIVLVASAAWFAAKAWQAHPLQVVRRLQAALAVRDPEAFLSDCDLNEMARRMVADTPDRAVELLTHNEALREAERVHYVRIGLQRRLRILVRDGRDFGGWAAERWPRWRRDGDECVITSRSGDGLSIVLRRGDEGWRVVWIAWEVMALQ